MRLNLGHTNTSPCGLGRGDLFPFSVLPQITIFPRNLKSTLVQNWELELLRRGPISDKRELKGPRKRIHELEKELELLRRGPILDESTADQKQILYKIELLLEQEELHWLQRGRANWLQHGDSNTNFFHNFASARRNKNTIKYLADDVGTRWEDPQGMRNLIKFYFEGLFTSEVQDRKSVV